MWRRLSLLIGLLCCSAALADTNTNFTENTAENPPLTDFYGRPMPAYSAAHYNTQIQRQSQTQIQQVMANPHPPTFDNITKMQAAIEAKKAAGVAGKTPNSTPTPAAPATSPAAAPAAVTPTPPPAPAQAPPAIAETPAAPIPTEDVATPTVSAPPSGNALPIALPSDNSNNNNSNSSSNLDIHY